MDTSVIDKLFSEAEIWEPKASHHKDTCRRCLTTLPPAHRQNRSSVGDCLLWLSVVDLLNSRCVWFCTANKNDFSDDKRFNQLHSSLLAEIKKKKHTLYYYIDPTKMVEDLRKVTKDYAANPQPTLPLYYDYTPKPPSTCPRCGSQKFTPGAYLRSQYGGLTLQYQCLNCGLIFDTGEFFD